MSSSDKRKDIVEAEENEEDDGMPTPPDGGWGWVVVFSSFMIHVILDGVTYTFGIFYMELLRHFKESRGTTSWVASIMVGTTFCVGPIASGLTNKYGCRAVTIAGSLLATFGLVMSTMAPSVTYLFFTAGLCTGAGFGLMYLPAIVCVTCYFEKRRAFATGIAVCGSGIGTFILAPFTEWIVDVFGWQGAMLIVAGLVLNCCVFGALFRPLEKKEKARGSTGLALNSISATEITSNGSCSGGGLRKGSLPNGVIGRNGEVCFTPEKKELFLQKHSRSTLGIDESVSNHMSHNQLNSKRTTSLSISSTTSSPQHTRRSISGPMYRKDVFYSGSLMNLPEYNSNPHLYASTVISHQQEEEEEEGEVRPLKRRWLHYFRCPKEMEDAFVEMMDFGLMKDMIFLMFGFSNFFTNIGFNVPFVYTKDRAVGMNIANEDRASFLLSVIGITNTIGRVILGYLSDRSWVNRLWLYNASLTLCGFATAFSSLCFDYTLMAFYAATFGATAGAYVSLTSVILVDLLGLDKLTNAFGLLLVFEGVACLIGPPITGWLYDYTGSYDPGFSVSGAMIAVSGLMLFFIPCVQRLQQRKVSKTPQVKVTLTNPASDEAVVLESKPAESDA